MENKINIYLFVMGVLTIILTLAFSATAFFNALENQAVENLEYISKVLSIDYSSLEDVNDLYLFADENLRITLISPQGEILFDSVADADEIENHLAREEVQEALQNGTGSSTRTSETVGKNSYYFAALQDDGNVLRVATDVDTIYAVLIGALPLVGILLIAMIILSVVISVVLTKQILRPINKIAEEIDELPSDKSSPYEELTPFINEIKEQRAEIKQKIAKVHEEKEKLSVIIKNMSEGIIILDNDNNILMANESAMRYFDFSPECINRNVVYAVRNTAFTDCIKNADEQEGGVAEMLVQKKNLRIIANSIYSDEERVGVLCLILDVTARFKADKMRREFTANVSHELKTPLTSISGYAELIETGMAEGEDAKKFAKKIHDEAVRMLHLVRDILKLSELDESDLSSDFTKVDLAKIAEQAAQTVLPMAEKRGITLKLECEPSYIMGNSVMLTELIFNLCDNAVRYNKENGSVRISVHDYKVSVKDTGIGIPNQHLSRIFERFYRVDKSRSKQTGGTGLGLAIVKHIAEQHNASVFVESEVDEFTQITVDFTSSRFDV